MEAPLLVETCSRFTYVTIKEWLHATLGVQPTEFFSLPYRLEFHISTQRSDLCGLHQHQGVVEYHISGKKSSEQVWGSPVACSSAYVWAIHIACGCLWLMVLNSCQVSTDSSSAKADVCAQTLQLDRSNNTYNTEKHWHASWSDLKSDSWVGRVFAFGKVKMKCLLKPSSKKKPSVCDTFQIRIW